MRTCAVLRLLLVACGFFFVACDVFPSDEGMVHQCTVSSHRSNFSLKPRIFIVLKV